MDNGIKACLAARRCIRFSTPIPKGYRCAILAALGWLTMAAAPAPDNLGSVDQHQPSAMIERVADVQADQAEPNSYRAPCRDGEYNNQSELCAQWYAARAARDAADWAYWAIFWTVIALGLNAVGLAFLLVTIRQGHKTYQAFVAVEDASLVAEFPNASLTESMIEGVKQPDVYFFDAIITNIGRSTARVHGWQIDGGKPVRREHTLKAGDSWALEGELAIIPRNGYFVVSIHFSSPLSELMVLDINARLKSRTLENGAMAHTGLVKSTRLRKRA